MIRVKTNISWGFVDLIEIFFKANDLAVSCSILQGDISNLITLEYENDSDTALQITYMSMKHLGFENMLCDYLKRCGYPANLISVGRTIVKRDMKKLDEDWEEKRKELGFRK